MRSNLPIVAAFIMLASCSKPPSAIKATEPIGQPFAGYECDQLVIERRSYVAKLEESKKAQSVHAAGDVINVALFGVIGLATSNLFEDEEKNIANYRGAILAIDEEANRQFCEDPAFFVPEPIPEPQPESDSPSSGR